MHVEEGHVLSILIPFQYAWMKSTIHSSCMVQSTGTERAKGATVEDFTCMVHIKFMHTCRMQITHGNDTMRRFLYLQLEVKTDLERIISNKAI